jgi:opacity protein-like surface antigen
MKKLLVIVLAGLSMVYAGYADAATPRKNSRSANRIGPYGGVFIGYSQYSGNEVVNEQVIEDILSTAGIARQNIKVSTEDNDVGYQAIFGFRFHRYFAAEFGLAQFGSATSSGNADVDFGEGLLPTSLKISSSASGPMISAIGILPLHKKFELFARLGYLFTSAERELSARIDGESAGSGSSKGESQNPVYGVGFAWNINPMYSIRGEFQKLDSLGEEARTGKYDLTVIGLGVMIRF